LKGSVIHERLVAEYGFTGHYQRVKMYLAEARPRIAAELEEKDENRLRGLHRRFETLPGVQAQVDWGDEGGILAHAGIPKVFSFHMVLAYSREPFICFTAAADLGTFWDCHRRAFAHFGGVPQQIVYDRTLTVVHRHVRPRAAVPLHPEAAAFATHYGCTLDVLAAHRPTGKGKVERQVAIGRQHVLAGRCFDSLAELDAAFAAWAPIRRASVHRTHGQVIGERAQADRAALLPLPEAPYLVAEHHLRRVGKDCLIAFEASVYSVPAHQVRPGQRVQVRATGASVAIHATTDDGGHLLAVHPRATRRGQWIVDETHWSGLPDGHTRATTTARNPGRQTAAADNGADEPNPLAVLLHHPCGDVHVARRSLDHYQQAATPAPPGPTTNDTNGDPL
jgi:transposase